MGFLSLALMLDLLLLVMLLGLLMVCFFVVMLMLGLVSFLLCGFLDDLCYLSLLLGDVCMFLFNGFGSIGCN